MHPNICADRFNQIPSKTPLIFFLLVVEPEGIWKISIKYLTWIKYTGEKNEILKKIVKYSENPIFIWRWFIYKIRTDTFGPNLFTDSKHIFHLGWVRKTIPIVSMQSTFAVFFVVPFPYDIKSIQTTSSEQKCLCVNFSRMIYRSESFQF